MLHVDSLSVLCLLHSFMKYLRKRAFTYMWLRDTYMHPGINKTDRFNGRNMGAVSAMLLFPSRIMLKHGRQTNITASVPTLHIYS